MPVGLAAMSVKRLTTLKTTVATLWLALSFAATCGQTAWCAEVSLKGAGSTFASLLYKKWIEAYRNAAPSVSISYDAVGSGEGIARFRAATVDFAGSDVLMSDFETAKVHNGVVMVPTTAGMIALAYNLPGVKGELKLPRDVYADIFAGVIKRWDDTRIRDANPGVTLPHLDIVLVARLDATGTTSVFTEHLAAIKPNWRQLGLSVGKIIQWPAGTMLASGSEALAARIKMSEGAPSAMPNTASPSASDCRWRPCRTRPASLSPRARVQARWRWPVPRRRRFETLPPPRSIPLRPAPIRSLPTAGSPSIGDTLTPPKAPRYANSSTGGCRADRTMASIWAMFRSRPVLFHSASRR